MRKGDVTGSVLGSVDETQVFASYDQTTDNSNGSSSAQNGESQAAVRGKQHLCLVLMADVELRHLIWRCR